MTPHTLSSTGRRHLAFSLAAIWIQERMQAGGVHVYARTHPLADNDLDAVDKCLRELADHLAQGRVYLVYVERSHR